MDGQNPVILLLLFVHAKAPIYPELRSHMVPRWERLILSASRGTVVTMASMSFSRQKMPIGSYRETLCSSGAPPSNSEEKRHPRRAAQLASPIRAPSVPHTSPLGSIWGRSAASGTTPSSVHQWCLPVSSETKYT